MRMIIFYKLNGNVKSEEILTKENLEHINGMMTKCTMANGTEEVGFADPTGVYVKENYDGKINEYIYLWTWDNLDENTCNDGEKYNQTFKEVKIDDIEKIEAIIYSNPSWGVKLTNKFEFYSNDANENELEGEITNTVRMNIDDTYFEFGIFNYIEGQDNDDNWTDIKINVHNNNFKYFRKSELMTSAEVEKLLKMIEKLLNDELEEKEEIGFYEPDLEFTLYPKSNLLNTGKYAYIKEGHEIQDIYMELNINLTDRSGAYTGQKYVMTFDRKEVEKVVTYMKTIVNKK